MSQTWPTNSFTAHRSFWGFWRKVDWVGEWEYSDQWSCRQDPSTCKKVSCHSVWPPRVSRPPYCYMEGTTKPGYKQEVENLKLGGWNAELVGCYHFCAFTYHARSTSWVIVKRLWVSSVKAATWLELAHTVVSWRGFPGGIGRRECGNPEVMVLGTVMGTENSNEDSMWPVGKLHEAYDTCVTTHLYIVSILHKSAPSKVFLTCPLIPLMPWAKTTCRHLKTISCPHCGKKFHTETNVLQHMNQPTGPCYNGSTPLFGDSVDLVAPPSHAMV